MIPSPSRDEDDDDDDNYDDENDSKMLELSPNKKKHPRKSSSLGILGVGGGMPDSLRNVLLSLSKQLWDMFIKHPRIQSYRKDASYKWLFEEVVNEVIYNGKSICVFHGDIEWIESLFTVVNVHYLKKRKKFKIADLVKKAGYSLLHISFCIFLTNFMFTYFPDRHYLAHFKNCRWKIDIIINVVEITYSV